MLRENNIDLQKNVAFPDHYELRKNEIKKLSKSCRKKLLISQQKNFYRLKKYTSKNKYIKIRLKLLMKKILEKINNSLC